MAVENVNRDDVAVRHRKRHPISGHCLRYDANIRLYYQQFTDSPMEEKLPQRVRWI